MPSWLTALPWLPEGRHVDALPSNNCVHRRQTVQQPLLGNSIVHTFTCNDRTCNHGTHFLCFPFWGYMTKSSTSIETVTCVEAGSNTSTAAQSYEATKKESNAWSIAGSSCSCGIWIRGPGPLGLGSFESETLRCGYESRGTRNREWLCWRGPPAVVTDRPVFPSEKAPHKKPDSNKNLVLDPRWGLTPNRLADSQLGVAHVRNEELVADAMDVSGTQRKRNVRRLSRYQATGSEDWEYFIYVVVSVIFGLFNSMQLFVSTTVQ
jgi:hypothetical protein